MSARQDLEWQLALSGLEPIEAHRMLDAYAHELAEKQRAQRAPAAVLAVMGYAAIWRQAVDSSADLIDPEVLNSGS